MAKRNKLLKKIDKAITKPQTLSLGKYYWDAQIGKISKKQSTVLMRDVLLQSYIHHVNELKTYISNSYQGKYGNSRKELVDYEGKTTIITGVVSGLRNFNGTWKVLLRTPKLEGYFKGEDCFNLSAGTYFKEPIYFDNHLWINLDYLYIKSDDVLDMEGNVNIPLVAGSKIAISAIISKYTGDVGGVSGHKYGLKDSMYFLGNYVTFLDSHVNAKISYLEETKQNVLVTDTKPKFAFIKPNFVIPREFCLGELSFQKVNSSDGDYYAHPKVRQYAESNVSKLVGMTFAKVYANDSTIEEYDPHVMSVLCGLSPKFERDYAVLRARHRQDLDIITENYNMWSKERKLANYPVPLEYLDGETEGEEAENVL